MSDTLGSGDVAAIGERHLVGGFALAGALVIAAEDEPEVRAAWQALTPTTAVVVLTPAAAGVLSAERGRPGAPLTVVAP